ncbi:MAG: hypothetical protein H6625_13165 [Bdellovibrionaceae bacterium]|nr:hypothetical protein [Pseudobdellovibrionaceae bacterium]
MPKSKKFIVKAVLVLGFISYFSSISVQAKSLIKDNSNQDNEEKTFNYFWSLNLLWAQSWNIKKTTVLNEFKSQPWMTLKMAFLAPSNSTNYSTLARMFVQAESIFKQCKIRFDQNPSFKVLPQKYYIYGNSQEEDKFLLENLSTLTERNLPVLLVKNILKKDFNAVTILRDYPEKIYVSNFVIPKISIPKHAIIVSEAGLLNYAFFHKEDLLLPHEILHSLTGDYNEYDGIDNNLLNHSESFAKGPLIGPEISFTQCQKARDYIANQF